MGLLLRSLLLLSALALAAVPRGAIAFEVRTTDDGRPVRWSVGEIPSFVFYAPARRVHLEAAAARAAFERAAAAWSATGAALLSVRLADEDAEAPEPGYDREHPADNENAAIFVTDDWDYDEEALAVTIVTFAARTARILDTDVLFNAVDHHWAVLEGPTAPDADARGPADVESVAAHELGHAVGLEHNPVDEEATMYPVTGYGEVWMRSLDRDDVDGVDWLYDDEPKADGPGTDPPPADKSGIPLVPGGGAGEVLGGCSSATGGSSLLALLLAAAFVAAGRRPRARVLALAAVLALVPTAAGASRFVPRALEDLAAHAEVIAQGEVVSTSSRWDGTRIVTDVVLRADACLAGDCGALVRFHQPGGEVDGIVQEVAGRRPLSVGTRAVVLLRRTRRGLTPYLARGVWEVVRDGDGRRLAVARGAAQDLLELSVLVGRLRAAAR